MPNYLYQAISEDGRTIENELVAQGEQDVIRHLQKLHLTPIKIKEKAAKAVGKLNTKSIKTKDVLLFTKQLYTLLKSGVPILVSLNAIREQSEEENFKSMIEEIAREVESGNSFSIALSQFSNVFPSIYINSVKVGEISGTLEDTLLYLHRYIEDEEKIKKNVKKAFRYPILVLCGLIAAFMVFTTFVIPSFIPLFEQSGVDLPLPTRLLIGLNTLITEYGLFVLIAVIGIVAGTVFYVRTEKGRYNFHQLLLQLAIIGPLLRKVSIARFSKTFFTMNRTGIPVIKTLETMVETMENEVYRQEIIKIAERIKEGEGIANSLRKSLYFSNFAAEMIAIGEKSGALDDMLESISNYYDMEVNETVNNMTSLIEPIMTVALGGIVLIFMLAIFMPMWDMMSFAQ